VTRDPSVERIVSVATALGPLTNEIVFIGGAIAPLLRTDDTVPRARPTKDVDAIVASRGRVDDARWSVALRARSFTHVVAHGAPAHRWRTRDGILFDLVPAGTHTGASGNLWDVFALEGAVRAVVGGVAFRHASAAAFIALKAEAYNDRGGGDPRASHDIEDVIALIASRVSIALDVAAARPAVRERVERFARALTDSGVLDDVLASHLNNADDPAWAVRVAAGRIRAIAGDVRERP
jgi:hypothetical protein